MSERYTKVFELSKNMYAENAPVVISAGALFKDNQTGTILAQLKIRNITNKVIKAAKVSILPFDTVGKQIGDEIKHEYLDLFVGRDFEFGQKVPITLPNNSTRSFSVTVNEIIFTDNSIWNYSGEEWSALREAQWLSFVLRGAEMVKQFKIEYGEDCEFEAVEDRDVWICSCGKINKKDESKCFYCGCSLLSLNNVDLSKLNEDRDKRVAKEIEQAKQIKAKRRKRSIFASAICILIVILSVVLVDYNNKSNTYKQAITWANSGSVEDIDIGINMLEELGAFKDSEYQKNSAIYNKAMILKSENPSEAIRLFTELGDFKDSSQKKAETLDDIYNAGIEFLNGGYSAKAYNNFSYLGNYKDSEDKLKEAKAQNLIDCFGNPKSSSKYDFNENRETYIKLSGGKIKEKLVGLWISCPLGNRVEKTHGGYAEILGQVYSALYRFNADGTANFHYYSKKSLKERDYNNYSELWYGGWNWEIDGDYFIAPDLEPGNNYSKYEIRKFNEDVLIFYHIDDDGSLSASKLFLKYGSVWANRYVETQVQ